MGHIRENKGQALILIVIVLFIVFFLVVSVSENITVDTVNTIANQNFQKALVAASAGLSDAKYCIANTPTQCASVSKVYGSGYSYQYIVTTENFVDATLANDQSIQADVTGSNTVGLTFDNQSSIILVNVILNAGKTDTIPGLGNEGNVMCIYYPQTLLSNNTITGESTLSTVKQGLSSVCGSSLALSPTNGIYSVTLNLNNTATYVRAEAINYSGGSSHITITPSSNNSIQEYKITSIGYVGSNRRILTTDVMKFGSPPGIFDYVLFNGGNKAKIVF